MIGWLCYNNNCISLIGTETHSCTIIYGSYCKQSKFERNTKLIAILAIGALQTIKFQYKGMDSAPVCKICHYHKVQYWDMLLVVVR